MPERNTPYSAEWTPNLQHRPDPNRVTRAAATAVPAAAALDAFPAAATAASADGEPSYYDVSPLKPPVWKWQIASYFFLGGLSAGAYILARLAERAGGPEHREITRAGTWVSFATVAPCPLLLIWDLGDAKRFHHMLRVFKPSSPMNLGTWTLVGYSGMVAAAVAREIVKEREQLPEGRPTPVGALTRAWINIHDLLGLPLAIGVAGYTGVLLSCTANPLWCKNPWLGPLFSASALSTGSAATSLAIDATSSELDSPSQHALERIDTVSHVAEAATMAGYLYHAGPKARALTHGKMRKHLLVGAGCLVGAEIIKRLPLQGRAKKCARVAASVLGLASGFSMRWAMVYGGHEAANDPHTARLASKPKAKPAKPRRLRAPQPAHRPPARIPPAVPVAG